MDTILTPLAEELPQNKTQKGSLRATVHKLLFTWELYPILVMAAFLHLYRIDTAVFVDDDAVVFRLARDLFTRGLLPITSNRASLGNLNPPMVVYLFMLPAAISGNPLFIESYKNFLSPYIHSLDIDDHFISWPTFPDSIANDSRNSVVSYTIQPLVKNWRSMKQSTEPERVR